MKNIHIILILTIVIILGFFGFIYYRGMIFSNQILSLEIIGPNIAKAGDNVEYVIKYKNNGNFILEKPKISFYLPDYSLNEDAKIRFEKELPDLEPGVEGELSFKGVLIGKEGDERIARVSLTYNPHNLSARYESDATYTTKIQETPIDFNFDLPSSIELGKETNFSINYLSHIDYPLENVSIKVDSIDSFSIRSTLPSSLDNVEWKIGTLFQGSKGNIKITGITSSEPENSLTFSAHLGMWQNGNFIILKEITQDVAVIQPQLLISEKVNGSENYQPSYGEVLNYDIYLKNTGTSYFNNLSLISRLNGSAFDLSTLKSDFGQFSPGDNLIIFDSNQILDLRNLSPQEEVKVSFSVKLKDALEIESSDLDRIITNKVNVLSFSKEFSNTIK